MNSQTVTSNTTITKGNIKYIVEMPLSTPLTSNAETTMKVTAMFQNDTNVTGEYTGENQSISVGINAEQDDGTGGFTPVSSTRFVYAFDTEGKCLDEACASRYNYSTTITDGVSDYTQLSTYPARKYFLKYEIDEDNVIKNAWACMKYDFITDPVCLKGVNGESFYGTETTGNRGIINGLADTFDLNGGFCETGHYSYCDGGLFDIYAYDSGFVNDFEEKEQDGDVIGACYVGAQNYVTGNYYGLAECNIS